LAGIVVLKVIFARHIVRLPTAEDDWYESVANGIVAPPRPAT
jgi:hypothetical protein